MPVELHWIAGLAVHWQWPYVSLGLITGAIWLLTRPPRQWRRAGAAAAAGLAALTLPWFLMAPSAPDAEPAARPGLRVASANLNFENADLRRLHSWLTDADSPDFLILLEFTDAAATLARGADVQARYPYQLLAPSADQFGIALLSQHPLEQTETVNPLDVMSTTRLRAIVRWQGERIAVTAMHPMPPINAGYAAVRDADLAAEGSRLVALATGDADGVPGILAGDLNDSPWSTGTAALGPGLVRASGLAATWPNAGGRLSLLPLDHVFVTKHWSRRSAGLGPDIGSDHRPVFVELVRARDPT